MNTLTISGNLVREPEVVTTKTEWNVVKFSIANDDKSKKNQQGGYDNITSFFDCEYWTKNPQLWLQKLQKGRGVCLVGELEQQTWQNKEGQNRSKVMISVKSFPLLIMKKSEEGSSNSAPAPQAPPAPVASFEDDNIPF